MVEAHRRKQTAVLSCESTHASAELVLALAVLTARRARRAPHVHVAQRAWADEHPYQVIRTVHVHAVLGSTTAVYGLGVQTGRRPARAGWRPRRRQHVCNAMVHHGRNETESFMDGRSDISLRARLELAAHAHINTSSATGAARASSRHTASQPPPFFPPPPRNTAHIRNHAPPARPPPAAPPSPPPPHPTPGTLLTCTGRRCGPCSGRRAKSPPAPYPPRGCGCSSCGSCR